jgi:WhiB family redox-sensing transcriptional regulator
MMLKFYDDGLVDFSLAECRKYDPEIFFPEPLVDSVVDPYVTARDICGKCSIQDECLTYALTHRESTGMWGGKTPRERGRIKTWRPAV